MDQVGPDPWLSGPRGWPANKTPLPAGQGLRWFDLKLGCHASTLGVETRVSGQSQWSPVHLAGWPCGLVGWPPPGTKLTLQVGGGPIHSYKEPPHGES
jgi:hypothetical protein